jgi:broad specificity phosphatase PhoE
MSTVWLIRHGESEGNVGLKTLDDKNTPLTLRGEEQAISIASCLNRVPDCIIMSPYLRSKQFALPTINRYPSSQVFEWPVHSLVCVSPTRCKNTSFEERREFVAEYWRRCDPFYVDGFDAESFADFLVRIQEFLQQLQAIGNLYVIVFTHQIFMQGVLGCLLTQSFTPSPDYMRLHNALRQILKVPYGAIVSISLPSLDKATFSNVYSL